MSRPPAPEAPRLEFLMAIRAEVGEANGVGPGLFGERRVVFITGGTFEGRRLRGKVLGGADWQIVRRDGAIEPDARYALHEARGGLVQVVSQGLRHGRPEVLARLARGEAVDPADDVFRIFMRFETGAADWPSSAPPWRWPSRSATPGGWSCAVIGFCRMGGRRGRATHRPNAVARPGGGFSLPPSRSALRRD